MYYTTVAMSKYPIPGNMCTGFSQHTDTGGVMPIGMLLKVDAILTTLIEKCMEVAVIYVAACGRNTVTSTDIMYALKYQAREFFNSESLIDDIEETRLNMETDENEDDSENENEEEDENEEDENEDDENEDDESEEDSEDDPFTRCEGSENRTVQLMNKYHDTWDTWYPEDPLERILKDSINSRFT